MSLTRKKEFSCCSNVGGCQRNSISLGSLKVVPVFQPVISINKRGIIGFEALSRGTCLECGKNLNGCDIFNSQAELKDLYEIDLAVRENAFREFAQVYKNDKELMLFINFDIALSENRIESIDLVRKLCIDYAIDPENVVIEINEAGVESYEVLKLFVKSFRYHNFVIALDDVGAGCANFDRIALVKPDIIKVDKSIVKDISGSYHKQEIFQTISGLALRIGAFVLAECLEKEEEILVALGLGSTLLQGYYFLHPQEITGGFEPKILKKVAHIEKKFVKERIERIKSIKSEHAAYNEIAKNLSNELSKVELREFIEVLQESIQYFPFIESAYIINEEGYQVTPRILNQLVERNLSRLCYISKSGDCHNYRDYFYLIINNIFEKYTTETYLSVYSNNLCRTLSLKFNDKYDNPHVLCMEINVCDCYGNKTKCKSL